MIMVMLMMAVVMTMMLMMVVMKMVVMVLLLRKGSPSPSTPPSARPSPADLSFPRGDCHSRRKSDQSKSVLRKKNNRYLSALKVDLVNPAGDLVGGLQVSLDVHPVVLQRGLAHLVEGHHIDINHDGEGDDGDGGNGEEKGVVTVFTEQFSTVFSVNHPSCPHTLQV